MEKILYIMRGISGSGKSTVSKALASSPPNGGPAVIRSTDDQFMVDGKYVFDQAKLGGYHMKNVYLVEQDMKAEVKCIIVDNTNCKGRDSKPYRELAKKYGYTITMVHVDAGLNTAKKRNATRTADRLIPEHVLEMQYSNFQPINLDKERE
jgi:predicted kinase